MVRQFTFLLAVLAGPVMAKPSLSDVPQITEGLITAGMAIELAERCGSADLRLLRGYNFLSSLESRARDLGYSDAEIEAYLDNDAEKARLEEVARGRLAALGANPSNPATYCSVAATQMSAGNQLGRLLR